MKAIILFIAAASVILIANMAVAENIDPENSDRLYSYGENIGWLNSDPSSGNDTGVDVDDYALTGYIWAENIGWISLSCENTGSCNTVEYGVVNDGNGNLTGYAWSENTGWINFSCHTDDTCETVAYGITIDTTTGDISGHAWGENIGWITFDFAVYTDYHTRTSWRINGDVSSDGLVTLADAIMTLQVNVGQSTSSPLQSGADVDGNNRIGIEESIYILNNYVSVICGDGYVHDGWEECDDNNTINTDSCVDCVNAFCGDGYVWAGNEECDDGNSNNADFCIDNCEAAYCGDGYVWISKYGGTEQCDDGEEGSALCDVDCTDAFCGDGVTNTLAGEECDDGNTNPLDGCDNCIVRGRP